MDDERVIIGKNMKKWLIPKDAIGKPISEAWPNTKIPDSLKDALIYEIDGREVIAMQDMIKNPLTFFDGNQVHEHREALIKELNRICDRYRSKLLKDNIQEAIEVNAAYVDDFL